MVQKAILSYNKNDNCKYTFINPHDILKVTTYNIPIKQGILPLSLANLTFGFRYNTEIKPGFLPPSLIFLDLYGRYDKPIGRDVLPLSLKKYVYVEMVLLNRKIIQTYRLLFY